MDTKFPPAFAELRQFAFHSAERAWTGLGHFFVGQSILALAWATVADFHFAGKTIVQLLLSTAGIVMGFQWALLGTRMWDYHLEYIAQLTKLWDKFSEANEGLGAVGWQEITRNINRHWRDLPEDTDRLSALALAKLRILSANQWILVTAPLALSLVRFAMFTVALWQWSPSWVFTIIAGIVFGIGFAGVCLICAPVMSKKY